jgi:uncharacterized protein YkwD
MLTKTVLILAAALAIGGAVPAHAAMEIPVAGKVEPVAGFPRAVPPAVLMSQVVTRTNQARHAAGCEQKLAVDHELIKASVGQSYYMAATGRFSHIGRAGSTFEVRAHSAGYGAPSGENIAWGYDTADEVMAAWMASPGHRANILNCKAKSIGTGVVYAQDGLPYYTEVFGWV